MKTLSKKDLIRYLNKALPGGHSIGSWTYNEFLKYPQLYFSETESFNNLIHKTLIALNTFKSKKRKIIFYHDNIAGWKSLPKSIAGYIIDEPEQLAQLLFNHIFFRDENRYSDNYNVIDEIGQWMITFCHEDDWYCFHKNEKQIKLLDQLISQPSHWSRKH